MVATVLAQAAPSVGGMTTLETALLAAIPVLAAAVAKLWHNQVAGNRRYEKELRARVDELRQRLDKTEAECGVLLGKVGMLERENARLLTQFVILSSSHDSSPLPQWIKDEDGKVIAVNRAYEKLYLVPRGYRVADYLHHFDGDVWPKEVAAAFRVNDEEVWRTHKTVDVKEPVEFASGETRLVRIIKYPRYAEGIEDPIGIAGIAIPEVL